MLIVSLQKNRLQFEFNTTQILLPRSQYSQRMVQIDFYSLGQVLKTLHEPLFQMEMVIRTEIETPIPIESALIAIMEMEMGTIT